jgi:hypothetical protein
MSDMGAEASLASCYRHGRLWQEDYTEAQAMWASQTTQLPAGFAAPTRAIGSR